MIHCSAISASVATELKTFLIMINYGHNEKLWTGTIISLETLLAISILHSDDVSVHVSMYDIVWIAL